MISTGLNLVMTVIGFGVSTMFIVFMCTRLVCARIHLRNSRISLSATATSDLGMLEQAMHGLEQDVIDSFPTMRFGDRSFSSGRDRQCSVCLAEYQEKDVLRTFPFCGHTFHASCIDVWLKQHSTCPICRLSLRDSLDNGRHAMEPVHSPGDRSFSSSESDPCQHQFTESGYSIVVIENQRNALP